MARAVWTGAISFGLVNVPVQLHRATESKDISFHQLQRETGERIRYQRVAEDSGKEVAYDDIVKGYEVRKGRYVVVEPEELEAVEPGRSRTIDIEDFVSLDEVDPIYFERTYYLAPGGDAGAKAYALLRQAMEGAGRVGIGRLVLRSKQHLVAIRPSGHLLVLQTMFFPDEVRDPVSELGEIPEDGKPSQREMEMAGRLLDSLTTGWDPERYHDTYREQVLELVHRKAEGQEIVTEEPEEAGAEVVDLMSALEASLASTRGEDGAKRRSQAGSKRSGGASGSSSSLSSMSKEELYEEAQRQGVSGRSKMSREQLIDALGRAS